jgi:hypothetical protein
MKKIVYTSLYTLVPGAILTVYLVLYLRVYFQPHNLKYIGVAIITTGLPLVIMISVLIFLFFNICKKEICKKKSHQL